MSGAARALYVAEPPLQYLVRPSLVVDCSVLAGLLFQEHWIEEARQRIEGRSLKAPWLLDIEITNVAVKKHRAGFTELARDGLEGYVAMDIERFATPSLQVHVLAIRYQLSAYDAAYLALALALDAPLLSLDQKLATAAARALGRGD